MSIHRPPKRFVPKWPQGWPRSRGALLVAVLALSIGVAGGLWPNSPGTANAESKVISIKNLQFSPSTLAVSLGDTVTWVNKETDGTYHSLSSKTFRSPALPPGARYTYQVTSPGSLDVVDLEHPSMVGRLLIDNDGNGIGPIPLPLPLLGDAPAIPDLPQLGPVKPAGPQNSQPAQGGKGGPLGDGTVLAPYTLDNGVKVFRLRMSAVKWEVKPGVVKDAYAFNGTVPGPAIRVDEGDRVRIIVKNDLPAGQHTAVHWHGMDLPNDQDGVPGLTQREIHPGETYTYEWTAISPGTHWYHTHMDGNQVGKGLYGSLEVVPRHDDFDADRDYRFIVNDGFLGFIANGKSFPATTPFKARVGERVRIRLIGTGPEQIHSIHLHGGHFDVVAQDGRPLREPYEADTVLVGPGQTYDIIFVPTKPGKWLLHCHIFSHSETMQGMQGMVTYLDVSP